MKLRENANETSRAVVKIYFHSSAYRFLDFWLKPPQLIIMLISSVRGSWSWG